MSDVVVGAKLEADASGYIKSVGDIRKEVKLAEKDVISMSEKFGATSKEAAAAAKRAAELKDQIGDAKQLIDAFNPDTKFRAFGASIQTVIGGFTALTGVMGLLGVESEEVQKTLLKVQSALALSQGIAQLQEGVQAFKNFGSVIQQTLGKSGIWGLAIAGIAVGVAYISGLFDGASRKAKELNASLKEMAKAEIEATKEVNQLKNSFNQAERGIISKKEALDKYNNGIGKTIGFAKDLNEAEKLTTENADEYIKVQGLKAQANYILGKSSELEAQARMNQLELDKSSLKSSELLLSIGNKGIEQQKQAAEDLKSLLAGINAEIATASANFKSTTGPVKGGAGEPKEVTDYREIKRAKTDIDREASMADIEMKAFATTEQINTDLLLTESLNQRVAAHVAGLQQMTAEEYIQADIRKQIADAEAQHRRDIAASTAQLLDNVAELVGKNTLAGKIMAIASATINTYLGVTKALASYSPPVNFILAAASLAAGLIAIKNIVSVKIPGKSGGSAPPAASLGAPLIPKIPQQTNTRIDQQQVNQIGNATSRSFVLEHDVTGQQERVRRLNRAARIG